MNYHDDHHHQFTLNHNYIYIKKNDIKLYFTPQSVRFNVNIFKYLHTVYSIVLYHTILECIDIWRLTTYQPTNQPAKPK